jgi:hypothetical protein
MYGHNIDNKKNETEQKTKYNHKQRKDGSSKPIDHGLYKPEHRACVFEAAKTRSFVIL